MTRKSQVDEPYLAIRQARKVRRAAREAISQVNGADFGPQPAQAQGFKVSDETVEALDEERRAAIANYARLRAELTGAINLVIAFDRVILTMRADHRPFAFRPAELAMAAEGRVDVAVSDSTSDGISRDEDEPREVEASDSHDAIIAPEAAPSTKEKVAGDYKRKTSQSRRQVNLVLRPFNRNDIIREVLSNATGPMPIAEISAAFRKRTGIEIDPDLPYMETILRSKLAAALSRMFDQGIVRRSQKIIDGRDVFHWYF